MNTALRYPGNALSPMQWRRFWRDGYVRVESLLNKEELSELRSAHDRLPTEARASGDFGDFIDLDAAEEGNHVMNIPQACQRDIAFQRLALSPAFARCSRRSDQLQYPTLPRLPTAQAARVWRPRILTPGLPSLAIDTR